MIQVGCLRTNPQAVVVRLSRKWTYNARTHIPYTEIPLWRGKSTEQGSYSSDGIWLRRLMPEKARASFLEEVVYGENVVAALNAGCSAVRGDDGKKNSAKP